MLWYKNWLETKPWIEFVSVILLVSLFLIIIVFDGARSPGLKSDPETGVFLVPMLALLGFLFLAGSGIRSQPSIFNLYLSSKESAAFTLSLPISRRRVLLLRAAAGFLEATLISIIFAILWFWIAGTLEGLTTNNLAKHFLKLLACGVEFYFLSTLLATFLNDFCHKAAMCLIPFLLFIYGAQGYIPEPLNIFDMMLTPVTNTLPWLQIAVSLVLGGIFLVASIKVVESQEF